MNRFALGLAALTAVAAALRFWHIGHQSLWYDEAYTVVMVRHSPGQIVTLLQTIELTPPLYYWVAWIWRHFFGVGPFALRSLSALFGVAVVPVVYFAGAKLVSRRAGLFAAMLATFNPLLLWYSQEARSYSMLVLMAGLSLLAFAYAREPQPTWPRLGAWWLAASLTLATHYYGALAVVPEAAWLLWVHRRNPRVYVVLAGLAAVEGALLPMALGQRTNANWISPWPLDRRLGQLFPQLALGTGAPARTWLKIVSALAILVAVVSLVRWTEPRQRRGILLALGLAVAGFVLSLLVAATGTDEVITRNVIVLILALFAAVGGALAARRAGWFGLLGVVALCAVGLTAWVAVQTNPAFEKPNWRGLVAALGTRAPAGGRAILMEKNPFLWPLGVDMPGMRFLRHRGARVSEFDVVSAGGPGVGWFCWWGSECNLVPSRLDTSFRLRGFRREGPVIHVGQFSILRLRAHGPQRVTFKEVARRVTTTSLHQDALLWQPAKRAAHTAPLG